MEQSPGLACIIAQSLKKSPRIVSKLMLLYHIRKGKPIVLLTSKIIPLYPLPPYHLKICINIILSIVFCCGKKKQFITATLRLCPTVQSASE